MSKRPFRHLCPEADMRDAMTDDEFWAHVAQNLSPPEPFEDYEHATTSEHGFATDTLCPECGEAGACAWDSEGRPMIHAVKDADDE